MGIWGILDELCVCVYTKIYMCVCVFAVRFTGFVGAMWSGTRRGVDKDLDTVYIYICILGFTFFFRKGFHFQDRYSRKGFIVIRPPVIQWRPSERCP